MFDTVVAVVAVRFVAVDDVVNAVAAVVVTFDCL